jgi:hypothetical protein
MIPSRPLDLGGIIAESIRIIKRTYWRAALLFIIFAAPGIIVMHFGLDNVLDRTQVFVQKFSDVSPKTPLLLRDYFLSGSSESTTVSIYQLYYPDLFHIIDSVREAVKREYPDSAHSNIETQLDSISHIVYTQTGKSTVDSFISNIGVGFVILLSGFILFILGIVGGYSAFYDLCCRAYEERSFAFAPIFRMALSQSMWLILIQYILIFLAMVTGLGVVVGIIVVISPVLGLLGIIVALVFLIYMGMRILFCGVALVSEELGPFEAIKRSLDLTNGIFWRVFGIGLICGLIIYIADAIIQTPISFVISADLKWFIEFLRGNTNIPLLFKGIKGDIFHLELVYVISTALTSAFFPAFLATFYYDLRTRREGELEYPVSEEQPFLDSENLTH